jgi:hypothetical protein
MQPRKYEHFWHRATRFRDSDEKRNEAMGKKTGLSVERDINYRRDVADYEVFIVFDNDDDAHAFTDWLYSEGLELFADMTDREILIHT